MAAASHDIADDTDDLPSLVYSDDSDASLSDEDVPPASVSQDGSDDEPPPLVENSMDFFAVLGHGHASEQRAQDSRAEDKQVGREAEGTEDEEEPEDYDEDEEDDEEDDEDDEEEEDGEHMYMIEPEDFDEDQELCWCPGCTQQRLIDLVNSPHNGFGSGAEDFLLPVTEALRQRLQGRAMGAGPDQASTSGVHLTDTGNDGSEDQARPPLDRIPMFLPLNSQGQPASQEAPESEPPDLPSARMRLACSQRADVLGGQKPPAALADLLASPTYLQDVLSRLPGVNPQDTALEALVRALKTSGVPSSLPSSSMAVVQS